MFKQRKHKTFSYKPRFAKNDEDESNMESSKNTNFSSKWREAQSGKRKFKGGMKLSTLIIILVLLLLCMYLLEQKYM
ncbi:hypothetical protein [Aestuariivivens insulae]|uniref:hypothetical protein n=1 Tax=Aestuariivivens insulae TaxID=1621988 RepID=UPI001F561AF6|nr:hypothetical protein [Aestuariivivens insulae]